MINPESPRMRWILLKFLKDSLDFLSDDSTARKTQRKAWAKRWQKENLSADRLSKWLPDEDQFEEDECHNTDP
jgi:hypothetical protein